MERVQLERKATELKSLNALLQRNQQLQELAALAASTRHALDLDLCGAQLREKEREMTDARIALLTAQTEAIRAQLDGIAKVTAARQVAVRIIRAPRMAPAAVAATTRPAKRAAEPEVDLDDDDDDGGDADAAAVEPALAEAARPAKKARPPTPKAAAAKSMKIVKPVFDHKFSSFGVEFQNKANVPKTKAAL